MSISLPDVVSAGIQSVLNLVGRAPLPVRRFLFDAIRAAIVAVFALNLAIPSTLPEVKAQALILGSAVVAAVGAAFLRAIPDFIAYAYAGAMAFLEFVQAKLGL